jgi:hypothetical protein
VHVFPKISNHFGFKPGFFVLKMIETFHTCIDNFSDTPLPPPTHDFSVWDHSSITKYLALSKATTLPICWQSHYKNELLNYLNYVVRTGHELDPNEYPGYEDLHKVYDIIMINTT